MRCKIHNEEKVKWGKKFRCKSCNREYQRKWFAENQEVQRQRVKTNRQRALADVRELVRNHLESHPCVDCGETDIVVLQFDHQSDKVLGISQMMRRGFSLEIVQKEIDKCEVRCANCHIRKTAVQFGWWKI